MVGITALWDQLVGCICRPPRDHYAVEDLLGGGPGYYKVGKNLGQRFDVVLTNKRGKKLQCSHFITGIKGKDGKVPCVIYCHCNSGSRRDAEEALHILLPFGISVFAMDFEGSGLSEGDWVTLGAHEVDDVEVAVQHLRNTGRVSTLGLWGRSMGAVTALLYSRRDPSVAGLVVDSPFSKLTELMLEIVSEQKLPIPKPFMKLAVSAMKRSVKKKAGFDISEVAPIDVVNESFIPILFGHAMGDSFIRIKHSETLCEKYAGDKNLVKFDGDHNSRRPEFFYHSVAIHFINTLRLEELLEGGVPVIDEDFVEIERLASHSSQHASATNRPWADLNLDFSGVDFLADPECNRAECPQGSQASSRSDTPDGVGSSFVVTRALHGGEGTPDEVARARAAQYFKPTARSRQRLLQDLPDSDEEARQLAEAIQLSLAEAAQCSRSAASNSKSNTPSPTTSPSEPLQRGLAAMAASNAAAKSQQPQQTAGAPGSERMQSTAASTASSGTRTSAVQPSAGQARPSLAPLTIEDEEKMLAMALEMSLKEASAASVGEPLQSDATSQSKPESKPQTPSVPVTSASRTRSMPESGLLGLTTAGGPSAGSGPGRASTDLSSGTANRPSSVTGKASPALDSPAASASSAAGKSSPALTSPTAGGLPANSAPGRSSPALASPAAGKPLIVPSPENPPNVLASPSADGMLPPKSGSLSRRGSAGTSVTVAPAAAVPVTPAAVKPVMTAAVSASATAPAPNNGIVSAPAAAVAKPAAAAAGAAKPASPAAAAPAAAVNGTSAPVPRSVPQIGPLSSAAAGKKLSSGEAKSTDTTSCNGNL